MLLAGLSEFIIIAGIVYALFKMPKQTLAIESIGKLALLVTLIASSLGAIKFLTDINVNQYHVIFTFMSKHIAVTAFIICAGWGFFTTNINRIIATVILISAFASLLINMVTELSLLSMIIMVIALVFTIFNMRSKTTSMKQLLFATACLLSTLAWGAFIKDMDTMIGVYHLCVGLFYFFAALSFKTNEA